MSVYTIVLCALFANRLPNSTIVSTREVDCANRAARACARSRSTFSLGVSCLFPPDPLFCDFDSFAKNPGSLYGAPLGFELA
jgi:hypothetical protein